MFPNVNDFNTYEEYLLYRKAIKNKINSKNYGQNCNSKNRSTSPYGAPVNWSSVVTSDCSRVSSSSPPKSDNVGYVYHSSYTNAKISSLIG